MCGLKALSRVAHPCYFCVTRITVLSLYLQGIGPMPPPHPDTTFSGVQIPYKNWPSEYSPSPISRILYPQVLYLLDSVVG